MKNIDLTLNKPYQRDANQVTPHKVSFSAEFDDVAQALNFMRDLNALIIHFNDNPKEVINNA